MESLKCAQLDIRSLLTHFDSVKTVLLQHHFHILGITESWLDKNIPDDTVHIDQYNFVRLDRGSRGGGVGFYIRNDLKYTILQKNYKIELIWVKLIIEDKSIAISVSDRAPNRNFKQLFKEFETSLSSMYPVADSICCLGDFNTDLLNFASSDAKYVIDIFESFVMKQLIKEPTRITANTATLIDYILTSNEDIVSDAGTIHVVGVSDHELVYCLIDFRHKSNVTFVTTRNSKVLNCDQFKSDLRSIPCKNMYDLSDVDSKVDFIV
nr:unnamed protein product [Callosobruchus analis]